MSMTREQLRACIPDTIDTYSGSLLINEAIPSTSRYLVIERTLSYVRRSNDENPLWGVCGGVYVTEGGHYDHDTYSRGSEHTLCWPIELILNTRPAPTTTHSSWAST